VTPDEEARWRRLRKWAKFSLYFNFIITLYYFVLAVGSVYTFLVGDPYWIGLMYVVMVPFFVWLTRKSFANYLLWDDRIKEEERKERNLFWEEEK
jgi:hypothetical protein